MLEGKKCRTKRDGGRNNKCEIKCNSIGHVLLNVYTKDIHTKKLIYKKTERLSGKIQGERKARQDSLTRNTKVKKERKTCNTNKVTKN